MRRAVERARDCLDILTSQPPALDARYTTRLHFRRKPRCHRRVVMARLMTNFTAFFQVPHSAYAHDIAPNDPVASCNPQRARATHETSRAPPLGRWHPTAADQKQTMNTWMIMSSSLTTTPVMMAVSVRPVGGSWKYRMGFPNRQSEHAHQHACECCDERSDSHHWHPPLLTPAPTTGYGWTWDTLMGPLRRR